MDTFIDKAAIAKYGLDDDTINQAVKGWDIILTPQNDVRRMGGFSNLKQHWDGDPHLRLQDLRLMYDLLCEQHPDYQADAEAVLNGHRASFCNMFIMKKELFQEYCSWLFPLLDLFTKHWQHDRVDVQTLRTPGHLSERMLNIFIAHKQRLGAHLNIQTLQCVHFTNPEPDVQLKQLQQDPVRIVPVVFAADDNYAPMLATTILSMLHNANEDRYYDVVILERNITAQHKADLRACIAKFNHVALRFYDVNRAISRYTLSTNNAHISIETYYRFIIQDALPFYSKILYLDCDLIVNGDVAQLYDVDLEHYALAAVRDLDFLGNLNMKDGKRRAYVDKQLHMRDAYQYFQAGVLVMNLDRMRSIHTVNEWLTIAQQPGFIYNDQDILNMECEGEVKFLPYEWNVMHDCAGRVNAIFQHAPADEFKLYQQSRNNPAIVHYAGFDKPWKNPWTDFGAMYWSYAMQTPFAPNMLMNADTKRRRMSAVHHERVLAEDNPMRKYADIIVPPGSKRRELTKVLMLAILPHPIAVSVCLKSSITRGHIEQGKQVLRSVQAHTQCFWMRMTNSVLKHFKCSMTCCRTKTPIFCISVQNSSARTCPKMCAITCWNYATVIFRL